ncbi:MAG: hypothetical protein JST40_00345 [Armatimonadetes bacterium]|nr:hypothetical protein [Armatimonadota bacterium]
MARTKAILAVICVVTAIFILLAPKAARATTLYVTRRGSTASTGSSWGTAMSSVQSAINSAVSGDSIWVQEGNYFEQLVLKDGVTIIGGFYGNEFTSLNNWSEFPTSIFGRITANCQNLGFTLSRLKIVGTQANGTGGGGAMNLSGKGTLVSCTISGGAGDLSVNGIGGGAYVNLNSSINFLRCRFMACAAVSYSLIGAAEGGALFLTSGTNRVESCIFDHCAAENLYQGIGPAYGGAIAIRESLATSSNVIIGNTFVENFSTSEGDAISVMPVGTANVPTTILLNAFDQISNGYAGPTGVIHSGMSNTTLALNRWSPAIPIPTTGPFNSSNNGIAIFDFGNSLRQDYHLGPGSQAFNVASNSSAQRDIDSEPRTMAGGTDCGADENAYGLQAHALLSICPLNLDGAPGFANRWVELDFVKNHVVVQTLHSAFDSAGCLDLTVPPSSNLATATELIIRTPRFLAKKVPLNWSVTTAMKISPYLVGGDFDQDNDVTVFDYLSLSSNFFWGWTDLEWWEPDAFGVTPRNCDVDDDGFVTIFDYAALSNNFGIPGDVP